MPIDSLVDALEVVRMTDRALDMTREERIKYAETRDKTLIKERLGDVAVRFVLRALTASDNDMLGRMPAGEPQLVLACRLACVEVRNADAAGRAAGRFMAPTYRLPNGRTMWSDAEWEALVRLFGQRTVIELGGIAYERLYAGNEDGGSVLFTVPPLLLDELTRMEARQRAERLSREQHTT